MTAIAPATRPRIAAIDIARGVAILAMIVYHFAWDLVFVGFWDFDITASTPWIVFQRSIVGTFIFLTGVSLALAHGDAIRWPAFWRRFAVLAGAALLVTIGTFAFGAETFVYFGVLHAIALFSLMGLAFLRLPLVPVALLGAAIIALPLVFESPVFSERALSWIGLWDVPPPTEDLVPVFPFFGVALLGIVAARWAVGSGFAARLADVRGASAPARILAQAGRWSLVIYLLHQPILLGGLLALAGASGATEARRADNFTTSCVASCAETAGDGAYCTAYCACALDRVETEDLWSILETPVRSQADEDMLVTLTNQCAAQVLDPAMLAPDQPQ